MHAFVQCLYNTAYFLIMHALCNICCKMHALFSMCKYANVCSLSSSHIMLALSVMFVYSFFCEIIVCDIACFV